MIAKFYKAIFATALIIFTISTFTTSVFAATDLKLNPSLNCSSDSNDGPLITGKNMSDRESSTSKRPARRPDEWSEKYNGKVDFIVVDLDSPRSSEQSSLLKSHYKNYIPHITVFNKEGKVVYDKSGELRNSQMSEILDGLL